VCVGPTAAASASSRTATEYSEGDSAAASAACEKGGKAVGLQNAADNSTNSSDAQVIDHRIGRGKGLPSRKKQELDFETTVYRAADVLKSRVPRNHALFRAVRSELQELARTRAKEPIITDNVTQLIRKFNNA
jgi:hypothetical protein